MSNILHKVENKVEGMLHKNKDNKETSTTTAPQTGAATHQHQPHNSATHQPHGNATATTTTEPSVPYNDRTTHTGPAPNTAGPHSKDWANKADPRVSTSATQDTVGTHQHQQQHRVPGEGNIGREDYGQEVGSGHRLGGETGLGRQDYGHEFGGAGTTGAGALGGAGGLGGAGAGGLGGAGTGASTGYGSSQVPSGGGYQSSGYAAPEGVHGPHNSRLANTADPRVDSDRSQGAPEGTFGSHNNRVLNAADPRIDSDADRGAREGTFGPHGNRVLNAADPRVDSDADRRNRYV